jgi:hypothetical protein
MIDDEQWTPWCASISCLEDYCGKQDAVGITAFNGVSLDGWETGRHELANERGEKEGWCSG